MGLRHPRVRADGLQSAALMRKGCRRNFNSKVCLLPNCLTRQKWRVVTTLLNSLRLGGYWPQSRLNIG
jgi:hypothetical protein